MTDEQVRENRQVVLKPKTTEEVSELLKYCNTRKLAIVPQGGNTGLVGGSVPVFDEIVLSLSRMNNITKFDEDSSIVYTQPGVILEKLAEYLKDFNYQPPLDIASKGSWQIGGNLATNAGGARFLKYNSLHANCIGIQAVLANGKVLDDMKGLRKDNTGYDLKHLLIGSEGTLAVITEAALLCHRIPNESNVALIAVGNFENVRKIWIKTREILGENLTALEFFDEQSNEIREKHIKSENPLGSHPFYMVIECSNFGGNQSNEDKLLGLLEHIGDYIEDGVIGQDAEQIRKLWALREGKLLQISLVYFWSQLLSVIFH